MATFVNTNGRRSTKAMANPSWKWKMREKMSERRRANLPLYHFYGFFCCCSSWNIGRLLAIITMNGHKNPTLFYDLTLYFVCNGSWWKLNNDMSADSFDFLNSGANLRPCFFVPNGLFQMVAIFEAIKFRAEMSWMAAELGRKHNIEREREMIYLPHETN